MFLSSACRINHHGQGLHNSCQAEHYRRFNRGLAGILKFSHLHQLFTGAGPEWHGFAYYNRVMNGHETGSPTHLRDFPFSFNSLKEIKPNGGRE